MTENEDSLTRNASEGSKEETAREVSVEQVGNGSVVWSPINGTNHKDIVNTMMLRKGQVNE